MGSRLMTLVGMAAVAAVALVWSAFAAGGDEGNGDRDRGLRGERFQIPIPPPPGGEGSGERFQIPIPPPRDGEGDGRGDMLLPGPPPPHHGPLGADGGELTWGELHVQRDGEAVTLRVDEGEVAAVDSDSITVSENDGNDVEIPIDEDTEVMAGPFSGAMSVDELSEGDKVHVVRDEGEAADHIGVLPEGPPPMLDRAPEAAPGESG